MQTLTRRDFIKLAATALGGMVLAGCRGEQLARTTAPPIQVSSPPLTGPADMILINGKVITVDAQDTIAQAIAIKDGLIQAVGTTEGIRARAGAAAKVVDLKGKTVTPGLIDPHIHVQIAGSFNRLTPFLPPEVKTIQDVQRKLADVVTKTAQGEWVLGYYRLSEGQAPKRQELDPISSDHPVWIVHQGGHYGSANSVALKIAGITADIQNPAGGVIERDARGQPTGVFYNHPAMDLLWQHIPKSAAEEVQENITTILPLLAASGVTSFQDNNVRNLDALRAYFEIAEQGKMTLRGSVYYTLESPPDQDKALKQIERYAGDVMRFAGYKFLIDGPIQTAYCHEPHKGVRWDMPTWDPASFKKAIRAMHDTGLQICVHCMGDAAVDLTLDAYETAMNANPRANPRHRIEHCVLTTLRASQRIKDLGVVICVTPTFIRTSGDYWVTLFDDQRVQRMIVAREWLEAGIPVTIGSDAPTTLWYTPQATLAAAVSRVTPSNKVLGIDQRLTIKEALRGHTIGAAYAAHEEKIKGSIEAGKLADLVVWNEDPYSIAVNHLPDVTIATTIVGGKVVFQV